MRLGDGEWLCVESDGEREMWAQQRCEESDGGKRDVMLIRFHTKRCSILFLYVVIIISSCYMGFYFAREDVRG